MRHRHVAAAWSTWQAWVQRRLHKQRCMKAALAYHQFMVSSSLNPLSLSIL